MPKISELTSVTTLSASDTLPIVQSGATKKATVEDIITDALSFTRSETGATPRTPLVKMQDIFCVKDFGAQGDGSTDDTAAWAACITAAKLNAATGTNTAIYAPPGIYDVTSVNFVGCTNITLMCLGNVRLRGTSVGGTSIFNLDGGTTTQTNSFHIQGTLTIDIKAGGSYQYGAYISHLHNSVWNWVVLSGAYSTNTVYMDFCWDNPKLHIYGSNSSGTAIATIKTGSNNFNRNVLDCRTTGSTDMSIASIGLELNGVANTVYGDFSSSQIGIKLANARGCTIISPYHEVNKYCISATTGNSSGNVIVGGFYEVGTNGAAFDLSNTQNTTIISPYIKGVGGGSSRTAFAMGASCYGLTVLNPNIDTSTIDTVQSGTWRGTGNFTNDFKVIGAQWIAFPSTQVSSSNVNTLDDYEEGTWTPTFTCAVPGDLAVTYATRTGTYTKIGRKVTASFTITTSAFTHATASGAVSITGLPFTAGASPDGRANGVVVYSGITKAGYGQVSSFIDHSGTTMSLYASGSGVAVSTVKIADMPTGGSVELYCTLTYQTAT